MKLHGSLTSPFVRKVRILVAEKGLPVAFVRQNPRLPGSHAQRLNPLGKVPVLELDDGRPLYDSPVILEFLDGLSEPRFLPAAGDARWTALRLQALADGMLESIIRVWLEERRPEAERRADFIEAERTRIERGLDALDAEPRLGPFLGPAFGVADLCVGVTLEYLDFRLPGPWRDGRRSLAASLAGLSRRPSFVRTVLATEP
jgi:glutathione S-transferase